MLRERMSKSIQISWEGCGWLLRRNVVRAEGAPVPKLSPIAISQCRVFVGDSAAEDFLGEVAAGFHAEGAGFDDPVIGYGLDAGGEVFAAALAGDDEVVEGRIWPLEHVPSIGEEKANTFCGYFRGSEAFVRPTQANSRLEWATRPVYLEVEGENESRCWPASPSVKDRYHGTRLK